MNWSLNSSIFAQLKKILQRCKNTDICSTAQTSLYVKNWLQVPDVFVKTSKLGTIWSQTCCITIWKLLPTDIETTRGSAGNSTSQYNLWMVTAWMGVIIKFSFSFNYAFDTIHIFTAHKLTFLYLHVFFFMYCKYNMNKRTLNLFES